MASGKNGIESDSYEITSDKDEIESDNCGMTSDKDRIESDKDRIESDNCGMASGKDEIESDDCGMASGTVENQYGIYKMEFDLIHSYYVTAKTLNELLYEGDVYYQSNSQFIAFKNSTIVNAFLRMFIGRICSFIDFLLLQIALLS